MAELIRKWTAGSMDVLFFKEDDIVSMGLLPSCISEYPEHRDNVDSSIASTDICKRLNISFKAAGAESMLQLKFSGDSWFGHSGAGSSMRNSSSCGRMKFREHVEGENSITSVFESEDGLTAEQTLSYKPGTEYILCKSTLHNGGKNTVRVEMFSSFSIGMISMLHEDDAPGALKLHRFATAWSSESRHVTQSFEEMSMDMSWQAGGVRACRFGQRSSCVNKDYSPFAAVEDAKNGVFWAAAVEALTPWQMEVTRYNDFVNISGGLPDREFDGWFVDLHPGETLTAPDAIFTVCKGTFAKAARNLIPYQRTSKPDKSLIPLFSDWCTSWGQVNEQRLYKVAEAAEKLGAKIFSVDDGWFRRDTPGDWNLNNKVFPNSFKAFSDNLKSRFGMTSGAWFEFETVSNPDMNKFGREEMLLKLDGKTIVSGDRRFWDMRRNDVIHHLTEKVTCFMRDNNIGYIKIDYNAPIPFGVDGESQSPAENLQNTLRSSVAFRKILRDTVPGLQIEECASGGNRMTPGWIKLGDYLSTSDAHEGIEIPIIAADTLHLVDFDKGLVWAVLRPSDTEERISYTLCAAMMGRMLLSGDLEQLSQEQLTFAEKFIRFYEKISVELRHGSELEIVRETEKRTTPEGIQSVLLSTGNKALCILHFFDTKESSASIALPFAGWNISECVGIAGMRAETDGDFLTVSGMKPFSAAAFLLERQQ